MQKRVNGTINGATRELLEMALVGYQAQSVAVQAKIVAVMQRLAGRTGAGEGSRVGSKADRSNLGHASAKAGHSTSGVKRELRQVKKSISAAGRKRIAEAQRKRWAEAKKLAAKSAGKKVARKVAKKAA